MVPVTELEEAQKLVGKIPVHLGDISGSGGNAFTIIGQVKRNGKQYARHMGDKHREPLVLMLLDHCVAQMMAGDYEHLLDTVLTYCADLDESILSLRDRADDGAWLEDERL